jgi:hypothetical protein
MRAAAQNRSRIDGTVHHTSRNAAWMLIARFASLVIAPAINAAITEFGYRRWPQVLGGMQAYVEDKLSEARL